MTKSGWINDEATYSGHHTNKFRVCGPCRVLGSNIRNVAMNIPE